MKRLLLALIVASALLTSCTDSSTVKVPKGQHVYSDIMVNNADNEASDQYAEEIAKSKETAPKEEFKGDTVTVASVDSSKMETMHHSEEAHAAHSEAKTAAHK
jgi:major membrane immunogen (membrane-anchored lipoprotein)